MRYIVLLFLTFFIINTSLFAQREAKSGEKGFFNITEATYMNVTAGELYLEDVQPLPGGINSTQASGSSGSTDHVHAVGLRTIFGSYIGNHISAGLGIGIEGYTNYAGRAMPLFVDLRYYISDSYQTVFLVMDYGTSIKLTDSFHSGYISDIGVGFKFTAGTAQIVSSIKFSSRGFSVTNFGNSSERTDHIRGITFSVGFMF